MTKIIDPKSPRGQEIIQETAAEQPTTQGDPPPVLVIRVPWTYLMLGDHSPRGQRSIYFRGRNEAGARVIGFVNAGHDAAILSAALELYNQQRNICEPR